MAGQIIPIGFRALDAGGTPYSGARLYTFDAAATTTPKASYADDDLSVSHGAFVLGDAGGNFPQAFAAEGQAFYLELRTSGGVVIKTFENVVALGAEATGAISRDFGVAGRLSINGDGGHVRLEGGPPTGDDVGGTLELSGRNGTALDQIIFNAKSITLVGGAGLLLRNYIDGLILSAAGASDTFAIAPGQAADSENAVLLTQPSALSKTTAAWAVGPGTGALDAGAIANNTWYHAFLIRRSDTGVVDALVSTSPTAPALPTGYDQKRRLGSLKTDGAGKWVKFLQLGDVFTWDAPVRDANAVAIINVPQSLTLSTPLGVKTVAEITAGITSNYSGTSGYLFFSPLDVASAVATIGNAQVTWVEGGGAGSGPLRVRTNTSSQVRAVVDNSNVTNSLTVFTQGWVDSRGRDA